MRDLYADLTSENNIGWVGSLARVRALKCNLRSGGVLATQQHHLHSLGVLLLTVP
jgi:hypothetical protein